jgi:hypothetical protein
MVRAKTAVRHGMTGEFGCASFRVEMKDARNGRRVESVGLWRALEEDARCAVLIGTSEGRPLDPESVAHALMHVYRSLPQASQLEEKLSTLVATMIEGRRKGARAS